MVLEQSSYDEADINAQRISAIRQFVSRLNVAEPDCIEVEGDVSAELVDASSAAISEVQQGIAQSKRAKLSARDADTILDEHHQNKRVERLAVNTGNKMIDQFEPWYFGVAFPFIFKYCTGMSDMPEWAKAPRYPRGENAPRVEADAWVKLMSRRVEAQLSRDWTFGFVSWNYIFRSTINLSRTLFAYQNKADVQQYSSSAGKDTLCESAHVTDKKNNDSAEASVQNGEQQQNARMTFTPDDFREGAKQLCKALWGKYGDFALPFVADPQNPSDH